MYQPASLQTTPRTSLLRAARPQTWHSRAVEAYRQSEQSENAGLRVELAARIAALIGRAIALESIYVDYATRTATATIDGITFQFRGQELMLLRHCDECGIGRFTSPPIRTLADLGYALSAWQPLCHNCQPEDPPNWLEREDI